MKVQNKANKRDTNNEKEERDNLTKNVQIEEFLSAWYEFRYNTVLHRAEYRPRGTAKAYSGLYKREFTEEDSEIRIIKDEKKRPLLTINGLPISDRCKQRWQQLIHSNCTQQL